MAPATKQASLVTVAYFISPEYESREGDSAVRETGTGTHATWKHHLDERDFLRGDWLQRNTLLPVRLEYNQPPAGLIIGENGVICQIRGAILYRGPGTTGPYQRLVEVKSTPRGRDLPRELTDLFEQHGYAPLVTVPESDEDIIRAFGTPGQSS